MQQDPGTSHRARSSSDTRLRRILGGMSIFHHVDDDSAGAFDMGWPSSGRSLDADVEHLLCFRDPLVLVWNADRRQKYLSALYWMDPAG